MTRQLKACRSLLMARERRSIAPPINAPETDDVADFGHDWLRDGLFGAVFQDCVEGGGVSGETAHSAAMGLSLAAAFPPAPA